MKGGIKMIKEIDKKHMSGHMKHKGIAMIVLGGLVLTNVYWIKLGWGTFIGGVLVLGGLAKLLHSYRCCKGK